jgi:hypothetical protein
MAAEQIHELLLALPGPFGILSKAPQANAPTGLQEQQHGEEESPSEYQAIRSEPHGL